MTTGILATSSPGHYGRLARASEYDTPYIAKARGNACGAAYGRALGVGALRDAQRCCLLTTDCIQQHQANHHNLHYRYYNM